MPAIFFENVEEKDYPFLYELLKERNSSINISHKELPSYEEHVKFCKNGPYPCRYICYTAEKEAVGTAYITFRSEIGIFVKKEYQGKGLGRSILKQLLLKHHNDFPNGLFANFNPMNERSKRLFRAFGFKHIQDTYRLIWDEDIKSHSL